MCKIVPSFLFLIILLLACVSATEFGYNYLDQPVSADVNYSLVPTVNSSEYANYWITDEGILDNVADISHADLNNLEWSVAGHIMDTDFLPEASLSHDIGSGALRWLNLYVQNINAEEIDTFNIHASENVSADGYFIGDGSELTGIATYNDSYVPYTGATGAVDLGSEDLTTTGTGSFGGAVTLGLVGGVTEINAIDGVSDSISVNAKGTGKVNINRNGGDGGIVFYDGGTTVVGSINGNGQAEFSSSSFPVVQMERVSSATNTVASAVVLKSTTSRNMADGFGGTFVFENSDPGATELIARFGAIRDGADDSGALIYDTYLNGVRTNWLKIRSSGSVELPADDQKLLFGEAQDASIYYSGSHMIIKPDEVGTGELYVRTNQIIQHTTPPNDETALTISNTNAGTSARARIIMENDEQAVNMFNFMPGTHATYPGDLLISLAGLDRDIYLSAGVSDSDKLVISGRDNEVKIQTNLNQTNGNATINNYYGGMWLHNDDGIPIEWNDTYQTVSFTNATSINGFSWINNNTLQNTNGGGMYQVRWSADGTGTNNHIYHGVIFVNEIEQKNTLGHSKGDGNGEVQIDGFGFVYLNANDNVTLRGKDVGDTTSAEAIMVNINLWRIAN